MKKLLSLLLVLSLLFTAAALTACDSSSDDDDKKDKKSSSKDYGEDKDYADIERDLVNKALSAYKEQSEAVTGTGSYGGQAKITFTPEEYITSLLSADINPTVLEIGSVVEAGDIFANFVLKNGDSHEIASLDYWMNDSNLVVSVPQLLDKYISLDLEAMMEDSDMGITGLTTMDYEKLMPSEEVVDEIVNAFVDGYIDAIGDVEVDEDVEVKVGGKELTANKVEIEITEELTMKVGLSVLKAVRDSEAIEQYIVDYVDSLGMSDVLDMDEWDEMLEETIEMAEEQLEDAETDAVAVMEVYFKGSTVVKRVIAIDEANMEMTIGDDEFSFYMEDGDTVIEVEAIAGEISVKFDSYGSSYSLDGTYGDSVLDATASFNGVKVASVKLEWNDSFKGKDFPDGEDMVEITDEDSMDDFMEEIDTDKLEDFMENFKDDDDTYEIIGFMLQFANGMSSLEEASVR